MEYEDECGLLLRVSVGSGGIWARGGRAGERALGASADAPTGTGEKLHASPFSWNTFFFAGDAKVEEHSVICSHDSSVPWP